MKTKVIALLLLAGASAFAQTRFSIHIGSGPAYGYAPAYNGYGSSYGSSNVDGEDRGGVSPGPSRPRSAWNE
jgi:hypothetical protein